MRWDSELVRGCEICSQHDGHVRREKPPLLPIALPDGPWQRLMIDVIGPMKGPQSEQCGIVLCDMYSRWPEVALCRNATAATIVTVLESIFCREPRELVSDNGPAFRSAQLRTFLARLGVVQTLSSPYSPQSYGMVERLNRTAKEAVQSARLAKEPRAVFLKRFLAEYRATTHPATGETPFVLMRGREPRTVLDVLPSDLCRDKAIRQHHRRYQSAYKASHRSQVGGGRLGPRSEAHKRPCRGPAVGPDRTQYRSGQLQARVRRACSCQATRSRACRLG